MEIVGTAVGMGQNIATIRQVAANDPPNGGIWLALGLVGLGVGAAVLVSSLNTGQGSTPSGLKCAETGQSCAGTPCCLGPAACDPSDQICLAPGVSSGCAQVGDSCQNTICCGSSPNVVCAPETQTCITTTNLTCSNCNPPNICNNGQCSPPASACANCTGINYCDQSTGICISPCDPPCANQSDCDMSQCGSPPTDGCGTCTGAPAEWSLSSIDLALYSNVSGPVQAGDLVDVFISFTYSGPGGNIQVGYNAWLESAIGNVCTVTLTDQTPIWIAPSGSGGYEGYYTSGMTWPQMTCFFCDGCAGLVSDTVYAQPFVITPDGQTWTGATVQGLFCC